MKHKFVAEVKQFEKEHSHSVNKKDFTLVFRTIYLWAFIVSTIRLAWEKTEIISFNLSFIKSKQIKPAKVTFINEGFLLEQLSSVWAIMKAIYDDTPTAFEINEAIHTGSGISLWTKNTTLSSLSVFVAANQCSHTAKMPTSILQWWNIVQMIPAHSEQACMNTFRYNFCK